MSSLPAFHACTSISFITYNLASSIKVNLKSETCKNSKTVLLLKFNLNLTSNWTLAMDKKLDPRVISKTCPYQRKGVEVTRVMSSTHAFFSLLIKKNNENLNVC